MRKITCVTHGLTPVCEATVDEQAFHMAECFATNDSTVDCRTRASASVAAQWVDGGCQWGASYHGRAMPRARDAALHIAWLVSAAPASIA